MKNNIIVLIFISLQVGLPDLFPIFAQPKYFNSVYGKVSDRETGKAIEGVNVFLSKTTLGTVTDKSGNYQINQSPPGVYDLVFQHVGFVIQIRQVQFADMSSIQIDMKLEPKVLKSGEIKIIGQYTKERKKRLQEFNKAFLGETSNAKKCKILNPEVVEIEMDSTDQLWTAFSDQAVVVENMALGYHIRNHLIEFKWSDNCILVRYKVLSVFKPIPSANEMTAKEWDRNRELTFQGSQKHFLSAFTKKEIDEEGFRVYRSHIMFLEDHDYSFTETSRSFYIPSKILYAKPFYTDTVFHQQENHIVPSSRLIKLSFADWLKIDYNLTNSYINLEGQSMIVDTLGNIWNPISYLITGYWAYCGIADRLPLDYSPQPLNR